MVQALLQAGLRAPSADNRHTLRFAWRGDTLQMLSTDAPSWAGLPHRRLLAHMAYGAVLENLRLRSLELGLALHEQVFPDAAQPHRIAELQWTATSQRADPLSAHIETRHTNRRFYQRARLTAATLDRLSEAALHIPGTQLRWLDAPAQRGAALHAIRLDETERFKQRELHHELFSAVRFDVGWKGSADAGLPPAALEVEAPMRAPFAAMRHWRLMRIASWLGLHHALGMRAGYLPAALSPHIGLVLAEEGPGDVPGAALNAGRAMQRVWLAAQAQGLALQPLAAATVLLAQEPLGQWVRPVVQARIGASLQLAAPESTGHKPCLLFRIGRASAPTVTTCRTSPRLDAY